MAKLHVPLGELQACWDEIYSSGFFTEGKYVRLLEEAVGEYYGQEAIAVSSAGAGLFSVMRCLKGVQSVAVSNNTFFATGAMAVEAGCTVKLVDCNTTDFCMSNDKLWDDQYSVVDAVLLTHVGGGLAGEYEDISWECLRKNIPLIEDAAHALGAVSAESMKAGQLGKAAVFSMYPTKAIPAGEGGIVVTFDESLAERLRRFRNYGKYDDEGEVRYTRSGFNFRMDEWTAAVAYKQFQRMGDIMDMRTEAAWALNNLVGPSMIPSNGVSNWYKYAISPEVATDLGITRFSGKVYGRQDQLDKSLFTQEKENAYPNSAWVANNHVCIPVDDCMRADTEKDQVLSWLRGEHYEG